MVKSHCYKRKRTIKKRNNCFLLFLESYEVKQTDQINFFLDSYTNSS